MTVLVAYATNAGSTAEIAGWIAEEIRSAGFEVILRAAGEVDDITPYEALVLGAAVYAAGWHTGAREFARRFSDQVGDRPVWLFSSGPLDHTADDGELVASPQAQAAMRQLHAREHVTFGGRLNAEARGWLGFLARRMTNEGHGGDFRDPQRVRAWARAVAGQIHLSEA
jgi:menaquinone-dependent protoporphyrinogen oxidase